MKFKMKRLWALGAAAVIGGVVAPLVAAPAAFAAPTPQSPGATMTTAQGAATFSTGNSGSNFSLRLPAGASCPFDSANSGWAWQTYMVPTTKDPSTLTFSSAGPSPASFGTYSSFSEPLFTTGGNAIKDQQTAAASAPPGPGQIVNIPDMSFSAVWVPGNVPAGTYNIGVACTAPGRVEDIFWNTTMTVTTDGTNGGPGGFDIANGTVPAAPTMTGVTAPATGESLTAAFTAPTGSNPAITGYTVTATPTVGSPVTASGATSPITVSGLTDGTSYSVKVHATNAVGNSVESNAIAGTPYRGSVQNLTATPGIGSVTLNWSAPAGPAPTGYTVTEGGTTNPTGGAAGTQNPANPVSGTTATFTGLTSGDTYTFTVTPNHPAPFAAQASAPVSAAPNSAQTLIQNVTVTRPTGAIVLTQICGAYGALPADSSNSIGFPSGSLPALTATTANATAPTTSAGGSTADPVYSGYPYPTDVNGVPNATYPTYCALQMGIAQYVKSGLGAGQFFAASGRLNQVTVVDTRDTDTGWNVVGTASRFVNQSNNAKTFSGSQLGWDPVKTSSTPQFTDSDGNSYTQLVNAGAQVEPNTPNASGLGSGKTLAQAPTNACSVTGPPSTCTGGLGQSALDARLKLLIPVTAVSGVYNATLTFSVI